MQDTGSTGPTSTCSFDQLSMLKDFTFEICVPNFRWIAAHRMHRNTPSYSPCQSVLVRRVPSRGGNRFGIASTVRRGLDWVHRAYTPGGPC